MILTTQNETDTWLEQHVRIGGCVPATFAPQEPIDLTRWIGPSECCSHCGTATPGLREGEDGAPEETCAACGETGFLITCWGEAQTERWERGERYPDAGDDGPQVGPIVVVGGSPEHAGSLLEQAASAWVTSEDRRCDN